jgi:hypothetical protein
MLETGTDNQERVAGPRPAGGSLATRGPAAPGGSPALTYWAAISEPTAMGQVEDSPRGAGR